MNDYIKREDAIDAVGRVDTAHFKLKGEPMLGACALIDEINDIPSADAAEVVRCKDCKWWEEKSHTCKQHSNIVVGLICETGGEDYCSEGERKEQDHE